jgi:hypothetical protein
MTYEVQVLMSGELVWNDEYDNELEANMMRVILAGAVSGSTAEVVVVELEEEDE